MSNTAVPQFFNNRVSFKDLIVLHKEETLNSDVKHDGALIFLQDHGFFLSLSYTSARISKQLILLLNKMVPTFFQISVLLKIKSNTLIPQCVGSKLFITKSS